MYEFCENGKRVGGLCVQALSEHIRKEPMKVYLKILAAAVGLATLAGCTVNDTPDSVTIEDKKPDVVVTPSDKPDVIINNPPSTTGN